MKICPECSTEFETSVQVCPHDGSVLVPKRRVDPLIGNLIDGKYLIHNRLGGGGMGSVYRGEHTLMKRFVAIKVLHHSFIDDADYDQFIRRFQREARTASQIDHPNAVTIHDFGVYQDQAYLVMQYLEGQSLKKLLAGGTLLSHPAVLQIVQQVCAALTAAHEAGIVHRDLKPDNIMVAERPDGGMHAVVLDFGIAKVLDDDENSSTVTRAGKVIGTPQYMAPEQVSGKELDHRADIYSLGIIIYELLCGKPPFHDPALMALMMKHVQQEPPPLRSMTPPGLIPEEVEQVVMRAIAKEPAARQQTMRELAEELEAAMERAAEAEQEPEEATSLQDALTVGPPPGSDTAPPKRPPRRRRPKQVRRKGPRFGRSFFVGLAAAVLIIIATAQYVVLVINQEVVDTPPVDRVEEDPLPSETPPTAIVGIGTRTKMRNGALQILAVKPNSPADRAGLQPGDRIVEIDGVITERLTGLQASERMRGPAGTQVNLAVIPKGMSTPGRLVIIRERIESSVIDRIVAQGEQLWATGKPLDAIEFLERAVEQYPQNARVHSALGVALQRTGQANEAIDHFKLAIELDPTMTEAFHNLGVCYFHLGRLEEAVEMLQQSILVDPDNAASHKFLGESLLKLGKMEQALQALKEVLRLNPKEPGGYYSLGLVYAQLGMVADAVQQYKKALDLDPDNSKILRVLGTTLSLMGQTTEGKQYIEKALALNPNDPDARLQLGSALLAEGNTEAGIVEMEEALRLNPNHVKAKRRLAEAHIERGNFDKAVPLLQDVLAASPDDPLLEASLGWAFNNTGRFKEAVPHLKKAAELAPQLALIHYNLGTAYGNLGEFENARDSFLRAVSLDPANAVAHYNLAKAHENLGDRERAKRSYLRALELSPDNQLFQEAHDRLAAEQ